MSRRERPAVALPVRVLVVAPHPDDESIGCGGTILRHVAEGARVRVLFLTSGEGGGHDGRSAEATARTREREAERASRRLGLDSIDFWRLPDGALRAAQAMADRLRAELVAHGTTAVYAPHRADAHRDHRAAARLVRMALAGLPEGLRPPARGFEVWTPVAHIDHVVDISAHIDAKVAAIRCYRSQCRVLAFDDAMRGLARYRGEMFSWPEGDYAEVFTDLRPASAGRRRRES